VRADKLGADPFGARTELKRRVVIAELRDLGADPHYLAGKSLYVLLDMRERITQQELMGAPGPGR